MTGPSDLDSYLVASALVVSAVLLVAGIPSDAGTSLPALVARGLVIGALLAGALVSVKHGLQFGRSREQSRKPVTEVTFDRSTDIGRSRKAA